MLNVSHLSSLSWAARTLSYDGCGCAGGEQITFTDERGRGRRLTNDVVGRLSKVEELNFDGTTYATTNYTYDVLDRLLTINQSGRLRTFDYDGHGRLESRTTPEQGTTTYSYNKDDTVNVVTDARGVSATYSYTNRHSVKDISYTVPTGVAEQTPDVAFTYDAAGHRLSMTETLPGKVVGKTTYNYNELEQMLSETRTFSDTTPAPPPVTLTYQYNWANELTKVTSSLGPEVGYVYDKIGRVTGVTGAGYAGVTSYVGSIDYRAFGAMKAIAYGNTKGLAITYDTRMRVRQWNVAGVLGWIYSYNYFGENTGRVTFADSLNDPTLDRSYDYDQAGRLAVSYTGTSARAHVGLTTTWAGDGPYAGEVYHYDQWGNLTERQGWGVENSTYVATLNAKNQLIKNPATGATMTYDAAGNLTSDGSQTFTYDATGQQVKASSTNMTQSYDGDGLRVKKVENGETTYYVRSSILANQVIAELDQSGLQKRGYVYLGGQLVAIQENNQVTWVHQDPVTKSQRFTNSAGTLLSQRIDLDPWGAETNRTVDPPAPQKPPTHRFTTYERDQNGSDDAMHRRYNGGRNRFDQPDPLDDSYDLTAPQSLNRYAYVGNDPVNFIDPTGLIYTLICWWGVSGETGFSSWGCAIIDVAEILGGGNDLGGGGIDGTAPPPPPCPPTGKELKKNPVVAKAINQAFTDSKPGTGKATEHEEGGWIFMDTTTGAISVVRAAPGGYSSINLDNPPTVAGAILVGNFHTHPQKSGSSAGVDAAGNQLEWKSKNPSPSDIAKSFERGVPGLIGSDKGIKPFGPKRRGSDPKKAGPPGVGGGYPGSSANSKNDCKKKKKKKP